MEAAGRIGPAAAEPLSSQDAELLCLLAQGLPLGSEIGRASCRERV